MQKKPELKEYVQKIYTDDGIMVICLFPAQAKLLQSSDSFEVDMAYKRVKDSGIREVVFTNLDSTYGYYLLFKQTLIRPLVVFCHVHFKRGIIQAIERANGCRDGIYEAMEQVLYVDDRDSYFAILHDLIGMDI
ncbi:hypothetical protein N7509_008258 [Penicillium cosmopolitanum]|uniref:Uncharacterized protein n=1 Tax=Penicillium cosmopolitanum TaxID=1131564 RepID=A0A9X0B2G5_9EURO|nr:uncharacterized protein N7509_008258 [Penicillium cosmopolitanum]KAJ5385717.1 hypothetical protein N7509_008258 [Penicillium cosmopolitanum]